MCTANKHTHTAVAVSEPVGRNRLLNHKCVTQSSVYALQTDASYCAGDVNLRDRLWLRSREEEKQSREKQLAMQQSSLNNPTRTHDFWHSAARQGRAELGQDIHNYVHMRLNTCMLLMPAHGGPQARPAVSTGQNWKSNLLNSSRQKLDNALHFQLVQRLPVRTKQSLDQPHCSQLQLQD